MKTSQMLTVVSLLLHYLPPTFCQAVTQFDAATIKLDTRGPGNRGMKGGPGTASPGRVTWQKVWLADLVAKAFHVGAENVSGPDWISRNGAQLYTFMATMPGDTNEHDFELMFQKFLIEQFKISLHHEPKMFPAYDLVVTPGGAKLITAANPSAPDIPRTAPKVGSDGFPILPPGHGVVTAFNSGYHSRFQSYSMSEFAEYLIGWVTPQGEKTHYVRDKTGLTGGYDFNLKFDRDGNGGVVLGARQQGAAGTLQDSDPSGLPSIFKAVEQQLGLKLVRGTDIPLDTIVIDHAERIPAGN